MTSEVIGSPLLETTKVFDMMNPGIAWGVGVTGFARGGEALERSLFRLNNLIADTQAECQSVDGSHAGTYSDGVSRTPLRGQPHSQLNP